ncbi:MAG: hypothetical protein SFU86_14940 [Pirellulaceae bacterium]|nr:hypothetical protein [Pirellulaceae bacterium]
MRGNWRWAILLGLVMIPGLALLAGCGGETLVEGDGDVVGEEAPADDGIKQRTADKLPKVGDSLPPLGEGKIEVSGPAGWNTGSRTSKTLATFYKGKASELPRITITDGPSPDPSIADLTAENCEQAAEALKQAQEATGKKIVIFEEAKPIYLGDNLYLRHVRKAQLSGSPVVIQSLQTIRGGRLYNVELMALIDAARSEDYEESLRKYRDYGYAVAANINFGGAGEGAPQPSLEPAAPVTESAPTP